ncbi:hypothetical protein N6H05_14895 [Sphingobium sp. WTD-1]|uniref:hypothetical protein n=1 Tax=Sphingobium sp. WTD-1 TaxID=2979467 RepID=UPI0024DE2133|nr:hypothetical protein [Sphingobium sp. WTD-1]WIA54352.1 hypothetical protein N6H05_14895 [Sphingobium sp. WTD-1]
MFGLMSVKKHKAVVDDITADRDAIHKSYGAKHDALLEARDELRFQKGQVATLSRRKDEETVRADLAEQRVNSLLDELANWRANGQLRDPKTGRLIPRAKTADPAAA